jgi:transcriptional regulator with XRE-family HTH domain
LAALAGISPAYLSLIEASERHPPQATLQRIADALEVDIGVLEEFMPTKQLPNRSQLVRRLAEALQRVAAAQDELKQKLG